MALSKSKHRSMPGLPAAVEPLVVWEPGHKDCIGIPLREGHQFSQQVALRASREYGAIVPSPLGRNDRLFSTTSAEYGAALLRMAHRMLELEPEQPWGLIGQCSMRENPGQGCQARASEGIKAEPDALDVALTLEFWKFLGVEVDTPLVMSIPREKGMGIPFLTREEAARATGLANLERYVTPLLEGLLTGTDAGFRDGALAQVDGWDSPANFADYRGSRAQPGKADLRSDGKGFESSSTKEYWLWNSAVAPVSVQRTVKAGDIDLVRARVRRVLGKNMIVNTFLSLLRRIALSRMYKKLRILPSAADRELRILLSKALGQGRQLDGDGTDTLCPPWLFPLYGQAAASLGMHHAAAMCLISHLLNFGPTVQPSNAWRTKGISAYGRVDKLINGVYMGFRSGVDTVAFQAFISQAHSIGRKCLDVNCRKEAAAKGIKLPTAGEFWHWYAERCAAQDVKKGEPSWRARGDGVLVHAQDDEADTFWVPMILGKFKDGSHLQFQEDPTASCDGERWVADMLRQDAIRRVAYFNNADDLRTDRRYLGIALCALLQSLSDWSKPQVLDEFVELCDAGTRGAVPDIITFAQELAELDVEALDVYNYETKLAISSPDRMDYMPEEFLSEVNKAILYEHRTYLPPERSAQLFTFASSYAHKLSDFGAQLYGA